MFPLFAPLTAAASPPTAGEREHPCEQARWPQEAQCGAHLPEEDAAGAHPAPARHLHRLRGARHSGRSRESLAAVYKAQNICLSITKHLLYKRMAQKRDCTWVLTNFIFFFQQMWVYDEGIGLNCRDVTFVPGLYKIFDEILGKLTDPLSQ